MVVTMATSRTVHLTLTVGACSVALLLAACSGSNGGSLFEPDPGGGGGSAPGAPQSVYVVAGDADSTEVQNTISWALDPDATDHTVYWSNAPGVTENSSILVPTFSGTRYNIHSGADVVGRDRVDRHQRAQRAPAQRGSAARMDSERERPRDCGERHEAPE